MCRVGAALVFCGGEEPGALDPAGTEPPRTQTTLSCLRPSGGSQRATRRAPSLPRRLALSGKADKGTHSGALPYVGQLLNPAVAILVATVSSLTSRYCTGVKYFNPFIPDESQTTIRATGLLARASIISITPQRVQ